MMALAAFVALGVLFCPAILAGTVTTTIECRDSGVTYSQLSDWYISGKPGAKQKEDGTYVAACFTGVIGANFTVQFPKDVTGLQVIGSTGPDGANIHFLVDNEDRGTAGGSTPQRVSPVVLWQMNPEDLRPDVPVHTLVGYKDGTGNTTSPGYVGWLSLEYTQDKSSSAAVIGGAVGGAVGGLLILLAVLLFWLRRRRNRRRLESTAEVQHTTARDVRVSTYTDGQREMKDNGDGLVTPYPSLLGYNRPPNEHDQSSDGLRHTSGSFPVSVESHHLDFDPGSTDFGHDSVSRSSGARPHTMSLDSAAGARDSAGSGRRLLPHPPRASIDAYMSPSSISHEDYNEAAGSRRSKGGVVEVPPAYIQARDAGFSPPQP